MKKTTILFICMILASTTVFAETWKDKEIREAKERQMQIRQENRQSSQSYGYGSSDTSMCINACGAEHGECVSTCYGSGTCIANCDASQGRCMSRCR